MILHATLGVRIPRGLITSCAHVVAGNARTTTRVGGGRKEPPQSLGFGLDA